MYSTVLDRALGESVKADIVGRTREVTEPLGGLYIEENPINISSQSRVLY